MVQYDAVVFAGAIYASGISGLKVLRSKWPLLKQKRVAVFCVGASPYDEKAIREVKQNNLKDELKDIPMFYGRGAWDESAMTFKDRTLCKLLQKMISGKSEAECEPWMKAFAVSIRKEMRLDRSKISGTADCIYEPLTDIYGKAVYRLPGKTAIKRPAVCTAQTVGC